MLGIRLSDQLEEQLERVAQHQGRTKSEVARQAIRSYVEKHDEVFLAEVKRQCEHLASLGWTAEDEEWEMMAAAWDDDDAVPDAAE